MFRRTTVSSMDAIDRSKQIYGPLGGVFNESRLNWRMPNGGRVAFAYLDSIDDANQYQGRNLTDAWVEEAGQYPSPDPILRLFGALRSSNGVPVQMILTGNPGGPGQSWIRDRYEMVPFPTRPKILERALPDGSKHLVAVIPSRLTDNKILLNSDPGYVGRLHLVGNWRSGRIFSKAPARKRKPMTDEECDDDVSWDPGQLRKLLFRA
jgi:Phage terminase large subunit